MWVFVMCWSWRPLASNLFCQGALASLFIASYISLSFQFKCAPGELKVYIIIGLAHEFVERTFWNIGWGTGWQILDIIWGKTTCIHRNIPLTWNKICLCSSCYVERGCPYSSCFKLWAMFRAKNINQGWCKLYLFRIYFTKAGTNPATSEHFGCC